MGIDFSEIMKKIIGIDELSDFPNIEKRLEKLGEGFVFQNNKPTHVIMTLEHYEKLTNVTDEVVEVETSSDGIEILLNKIGKKVFVDYYEVFKEDNDPEVALETEGFTLTSRRSRSSSARSIFKNNFQIIALTNIVNSDRVDVETREKAKALLEYEKNGVVVEENLDEIQGNYYVKIGKMMRGILGKTIQNGILNDEELIKLQDAEYSKKIMNLNFPVLKVVEENQLLADVKKDAKGYNRYYDSIVLYKGKQYVICSQWVENLHRESVTIWIREKMVKLLVDISTQKMVGEEFEVRDMVAEYWPYIDYATRISIGREFKKVVLEKNFAKLGEKRHNRQIYIKI